MPVSNSYGRGRGGSSGQAHFQPLTLSEAAVSSPTILRTYPAISIVGVVTGTSGAGTSANPNIVLPTVQDDDWLIWLVSSSAGVGTMTSTLDPPLVFQAPASTLAERVWTHKLTAAESGTTITATAAAAKWNSIGVVVRGVSAIDTITSASDATASTSATLPANTPTVPGAAQLALSALRYTAATTASYTAPATGGWVELADLVGGASPVNAAAASFTQLTGGPAANGPYTATIANGTALTSVLSLAPVGTTVTGGSIYDPAAVLAIGDSLFDRIQSDDSPNAYGGPYTTDPIKDALVAAGWASTKVYTSGKASRKIADSAVGLPITQNLIQSFRDAGVDPRTYVIALGTNNRTDTQAAMLVEINKVLDKIAEGVGPYQVNWFGTSYPDSNTTDQASVALLKAAVLQAQAARAGGIITVNYIDWDQINRAYWGTGSTRDAKWEVDGVHHDALTDGYTFRNTVLANGPSLDSAASVDAATLSASLTGADTAASAEATSLATTQTAGDTASAVDAAAVAIALTAADTATTTDTASVATGTAVSGSDTASGADAATLAAAMSAADTAASVDTATLATSPTAADTGSSVGAASLVANLTAPDTGTGADSSTLSVTITAADVAAAADSASVNTGSTFTANDTAAGADAATLQTNLTAADTGHAVDAASVAVLVTATDNATAAELAALSVTVAAADLAHALETAGATQLGADVEITYRATLDPAPFTATLDPPAYVAALEQGDYRAGLDPPPYLATIDPRDREAVMV